MKVLVIADIHGNAEALRAVLEKERDADTAIFLGDAASPGPQPNETLALLTDLSGTFIVGNHDLEVLEPDRVAGWPAPWRALHDWSCRTLDVAGVEFLRTFRDGGDFEIDGLRMCLQHGTVPGRVRHVVPDTSDDDMVALAHGSDCPLVFFGHSHVQFRRTVGDQEFINPGSVGQNRCGHVLACYGVLEDGAFRHCHVEFDPAPYLAALDRIEPLDGFPDFREWLKRGLLTGYGIGENEPWTRFAREGYR